MRADQHADASAHGAVVHDPALLHAMRDITWIGSSLVVDLVVVAVAIAALLLRRRRIVLYVVSVRIVELVIVTVLKHGIERSRPHFAHAVAHASGYSFPSGHAGGSAAVYGAIAVVAVAWLRRRLAFVAVAAAVLLATAVGASRILLGVHYPSDVFGGYLVALLVVSAAGIPCRGRGRHGSP